MRNHDFTRLTEKQPDEKGSDALQILAGSGIDLYHITDIDKKRYGDLRAGLHDRRLGCALSGIACKARLGIRDFKLYEKRRLD